MNKWVARFNPYPPADDDCPIFPVCGEECETLYRQGNEILGCDNCIVEVNAWEWQEEQEEQEEQ